MSDLNQCVLAQQNRVTPSPFNFGLWTWTWIVTIQLKFFNMNVIIMLMHVGGVGGVGGWSREAHVCCHYLTQHFNNVCTQHHAIQ